MEPHGRDARQELRCGPGQRRGLAFPDGSSERRFLSARSSTRGGARRSHVRGRGHAAVGAVSTDLPWIGPVHGTGSGRSVGQTRSHGLGAQGLGRWRDVDAQSSRPRRRRDANRPRAVVPGVRPHVGGRGDRPAPPGGGFRPRPLRRLRPDARGTRTASKRLLIRSKRLLIRPCGESPSAHRPAAG